jgi:hypothetical protein
VFAMLGVLDGLRQDTHHHGLLVNSSTNNIVYITKDHLNATNQEEIPSARVSRPLRHSILKSLLDLDLRVVKNVHQFAVQGSAVIISNAPVLVIMEELGLSGNRVRAQVQDITGYQSSEDCEGHAQQNCNSLVPPLVVHIVAPVDGRIMSMTGALESSNDDTGKATDDGGHAVQVVDTASVVDAQLVFQERHELVVSAYTDNTGSSTNANSSKAGHGQVGGTSDGDTTSKRCILNVNGSEAAVFVKDGAQPEGAHRG